MMYIAYLNLLSVDHPPKPGSRATCRALYIRIVNPRGKDHVTLLYPSDLDDNTPAQLAQVLAKGIDPPREEKELQEALAWLGGKGEHAQVTNDHE